MKLDKSPRDRQVGGDHYRHLQVQPWDVIDSWPRDQRIGFYRGNVLKYLLRLGAKDPARSGVEDAKKAQHYLEKLVTVLDE